MEAEYANLDAFFSIVPWVFLFLIPAVTMRSFAEEQKEGTMEWLMTKPITDLQIVLAKYLAGLIVVTIAIFPTLIYFLSVYLLGNPVGNIDVGATWGSYLGLIFLASVYVSIGIFASSLTKNQIVAFLIAAFLSFVMYFAFHALGTFNLFGSFDRFIIRIGMQEHFLNLSIGLIDSRDVLYFLGISTFFILLTRLSIASRNWGGKTIIENKFELFVGIGLLLLGGLVTGLTYYMAAEAGGGHYLVTTGLFSSGLYIIVKWIVKNSRTNS
jgi:ABC-2 type transport system permease protein